MRILQQRNKVVRDRRNYQSNCLRQDDLPNGLHAAQSECERGIHLALRDRLDSGAIVLRFIGRIVDAQPDNRSP